MELYEIKIKYNNYNYDHLYLNYLVMFRANYENDQLILLEKFAAGDHKKLQIKKKLLRINGIEAHYFIQELAISKNYRSSLINSLKKLDVNMLVIKLKTADKEIVDYKGNEITNYSAWERLELDHALSWLSTLGGAFSALGDYFSNAALMAGKISLHQFKLALRLNDPNIQSRCRLFLSLSLIQQKRYKLAKQIIKNEYQMAKNNVVADHRLVKMCQGIWAKLKYEWNEEKRKLKQI